jgi:hypothetical protein
MPERPLLLFGKPEDANRYKRKLIISPPHLPSYVRQKERLEPQFKILQDALDRGSLILQNSPDGVDQEYTLVLEAIGELKSFHSAIRKLNIELQFETQIDDVFPDDDFYVLDTQNEKNDTKKMTFKYFCILSNQQALNEILSLWKHFCADEHYQFPRGNAGLRDVFKSLKDIHLWGVRERFEETGVKQAWEYDLADETLPNVKCEIEFVYHSQKEKRDRAQQRVESMLAQQGGSVITSSCINDISYHAILALIPRQVAVQILQQPEVSFIGLNEIFFVRPTGQMAVASTQDSLNYEQDVTFPESIEEQPIIALFDGLPQENHPLLGEFLTIDDPDGYTVAYPVKDRQHGTSMASIIAWGDLNNNSAITHKIYVRPIMKPKPGYSGVIEYVPDDVLLVDQIHIAVRHLFEPIAGQAAPTVRVINLSIGDPSRIYDNFTSPLAKLLDWLSFRYKVLFIVSAGNHNNDIDLGMHFDDFVNLPDDQKDASIIKAIEKGSRHRRLLSPAESMNALTVGALFADGSSFTPNPRQLLPCSETMPSPINALGRGINHSIKPDLLINGGRGVLLENMTQHNIAHWRSGVGVNPPGILSAKPTDPTGGNSVGYNFGTSDAAAMLSHNAMQCYDVLDEVFKSNEQSIPHEYAALLLKAMLVHGCKWNKDLCTTFSNALSLPSKGKYDDIIHKWIGYGVPDIDRVKECAKNRITLIGFDELKKDAAHVYAVPIPFDFTRRMARTLTVTLAYFSPCAYSTKKYRKAQVWFNLENGKDLVGKRLDADDSAVKRGTLQHERFSCDATNTWGHGNSLEIKVNCREDATGLTDTIPYTLFVTFEIAPEYDIDVYTQIRDSIKVKQTVRATAE